MKKVVPKLRQEVKVKVDIVTSDDIKIYYTGKFQDFTARYIIREFSACPRTFDVQSKSPLWQGIFIVLSLCDLFIHS